MHCSPTALVFTALASVGAATLHSPGPRYTPPSDTVDWVYSYPEALQQARATGKPILLEFRCAP